MDSSTFLFTPAPPSNAMPLDTIVFFAAGNTSLLFTTLVMKLRTGSLEIGLVCAGVVPGGDAETIVVRNPVTLGHEETVEDNGFDDGDLAQVLDPVGAEVPRQPPAAADSR